MSLHPSQIPALVTDTGVGVIADTYDADSLYFPQFCRVLDPSAASDPFYGDASTTLHFGTDPVERQDGQPHSETSGGQGYTVLTKIRQYSRVLTLPERMLTATDAKARAVRQVSEFAEQFARGAGVQKDTLVASLLNNGALTAGHEDFDGGYVGHVDANRLYIFNGQPWFDTAQVIKFGTGTYSNHTASSALTNANLNTAYTTVTTTNAVDETGKRISIRPDLLIVPNALRTTAFQLLNSEKLPSSANNDINPNQGLLKPILNPYLTDTDGWFIGSTTRGLRVFDSGAPRLKTWFDEDTSSQKVKLEYWFGVGVDDWRGWHACNVAAS